MLYAYTCIDCSDSVERDHTYGRKPTLCEVCFRKRYGKQPSPRRAPEEVALKCKRCGLVWRTTVKSGPHPSYCSPECFRAARRIKNDPEYRKQANAKATAAYRADAKARERKQLRHLERLASDPSYAERRRRYAAAVFQRKWKDDPQFRLARYATASKYYAMSRGASNAETFTLDYIFWRDHERCHLCRKKVKRKDASMDHLVPVSLGGEHTKANVALAHFSCNSRKKTKAMGEQLALFG